MSSLPSPVPALTGDQRLSCGSGLSGAALALPDRLTDADQGVPCACGRHRLRLYSTPEYAGGRATGERNYHAVCSCGSAREFVERPTPEQVTCDACAEYATGRQRWFRFQQARFALGATLEVID